LFDLDVEILTTLEYWTASDNRQLIAPWHGLPVLASPVIHGGWPSSFSEWLAGDE